MEILGLILVVFLFFWLVGGKKKPYKNRRNQYKQRKPYSSNRKKLKPKINPTSFEPFSGYAHVIDGDTIKIRGMKIRLAGINAPELDRPYGVKSKYEMVNIVKGKKVYVVPDGTTSFDRIVATCYVDGDVDILIFFWDPMQPQPHDVDVKALLRITVLYNIPTASNRSTADFLVSSSLFHESYNPILKDYQGYISRDVDMK